MKNGLRCLGLGALCTSAALSGACGDDSDPTPATVGADASLDATTSDVGTSDVQSGGDGGVDVLVVDAAPDAPWCGDQRDGGALCPKGQWRDFGPPDAADAGACNACPTAPLTCQAAVLRLIDGGITFEPPKFDTNDATMRVTLPHGQLEGIEITNVTADVNSGCFGQPAGSGTTQQAISATIEGDVIVFDFSGSVGTRPCGAITFTLKDACCTTSTVTVNAYWDGEAGRINNGSCPDGG